MSQLKPFIKTFANGRRALTVRTNGQIDPAEIAAALKLPPCTRLLLISGGAGNMSGELFTRLRALFAEVGRVIAHYQGTVIDGGTQSGVMQLMGEALAHAGSQVAHIGVLPAHADIGQAGLHAEDIMEPHHPYFVLVEGYLWGDEVETMYALAGYLSANVPSVTLLVNGGAIALHEIEWNVRQNREVIVIAGSGRLADEIANAVQNPQANVRDRIATIVRNGRLTIFDIKSPPEELGRLLEQRLN